MTNNSLLNNIKAYLTFISAVIQFFMLGFQFSWGNVSAYFASQLKTIDPDIRSTDLLTGLPVAFIVQASTLWISPILIRYINHRLILIIGQTLGLGGIYLSSYATNTTQVLCTQNAGWGCLMGLCQLPTLQCTLLWFPNHKGLITGLIVGTLGVATMFLNQMTDQLINPLRLDPVKQGNDKIFPTEISNAVPGSLRTIAMIFAVMGAVIICLCFRPEEVEERSVSIPAARDNNNDIMDNQANNDKLIDKKLISNNNLENEVKPTNYRMKVLMSKNFIQCFINNVLSFGTGAMIASLQQSHGFLMDQGVQEMSLIGFLGSINNGWSRVFLAQVAQEFNYKTTQQIMLGVQLSALILLVAVDNIQVQMLSNIAIFWVTGGHFVNTIVQQNKIFSKKYAGELQGYYFFSFLIANLLNFPLKNLYQMTNYFCLILTLIACNIVCLINLTFFFDFEDRIISEQNETETANIHIN